MFFGGEAQGIGGGSTAVQSRREALDHPQALFFVHIPMNAVLSAPGHPNNAQDGKAAPVEGVGDSLPARLSRRRKELGLTERESGRARGRRASASSQRCTKAAGPPASSTSGRRRNSDR